MIIHQILPNFSYGDAIGDDTLALKRVFQNLGYESQIFAGVIHSKLMDEAEDWSGHRHISSSENILIYHFSVGSEITDYVMDCSDKLVVIFHNITPAHWFFGNSPHMTEVASQGMQELVKLKDRVHTAWADSEYNASILRSVGYTDVHVLPIVMEMQRLSLQPSRLFTNIWKSNQYTWLFVGRLSPNKCHQDIINTFAAYKKYINPASRLILVGEYRNCWRYTREIMKRVKALGIGDVHFTGMIDDDELVSMYQMADVFICMSEHEGFCVPLLEAMHFDLPVIAYEAGAVPETMGGAGLVVNSKQPVELAELVELIRTDDKFRSKLVEKQKTRLENFRSMDIEGRVDTLLKETVL